MNKDALLATIIGFGVGLVIAALVFLGPSVLKNLPKMTVPDISFMWTKSGKKPNDSKPVPTPKSGKDLIIESPLPDAIETKDETLISGITLPNAVVVIEGESSENVITANGNGNYAGTLSLGEGKNDITVTSYAKDTIQSQTVRVYYTPENF